MPAHAQDQKVEDEEAQEAEAQKEDEAETYQKWQILNWVYFVAPLI